MRWALDNGMRRLAVLAQVLVHLLLLIERYGRHVHAADEVLVLYGHDGEVFWVRKVPQVLEYVEDHLSSVLGAGSLRPRLCTPLGPSLRASKELVRRLLQNARPLRIVEHTTKRRLSASDLGIYGVRA